MDHSEALQANACEKYLLGELTPELRDAYELHYFSCEECAFKLRAAADFLAASREVLAESLQPSRAALPQPQASSHGWLAWLKPAFAIPVFAAMLLLIGYQNFVTIPRYQRAGAPRILPTYSLINANSRGSGESVFTISPDQPAGLFVDVPADPAYSTYLLALQDPSGAITPLQSLSYAEARKPQVVTFIPARQVGKYTLIISGLAGSSADASSATELARMQFTIAFRN